MLIDVFELAEVKLTLLEQLQSCSMQPNVTGWIRPVWSPEGIVAPRGRGTGWQQFLPGGPTGSSQKKRAMTNTERMGWTTQVTICLGAAIRWVMMDTADHRSWNEP